MSEETFKVFSSQNQIFALSRYGPGPPLRIFYLKNAIAQMYLYTISNSRSF